VKQMRQRIGRLPSVVHDGGEIPFIKANVCLIAHSHAEGGKRVHMLRNEAIGGNWKEDPRKGQFDVSTYFKNVKEAIFRIGCILRGSKIHADRDLENFSPAEYVSD